MGKYSFLIKPVFYILSLIFSCWMVLSIEKISPSDFGKYKSLFERSSSEKKVSDDNDQNSIAKIRNIYSEFKRGLIDSSTFFHRLDAVANEDEQSNRNKNADKLKK